MRKIAKILQIIISIVLLTKLTTNSVNAYGCALEMNPSTNITDAATINVRLSIISFPMFIISPYPRAETKYDLKLDGSTVSDITTDNGVATKVENKTIGPLRPGNHVLRAELRSCLPVVGRVLQCQQECIIKFPVSCSNPASCPKDWQTKNWEAADACQSIKGTTEYDKCNECVLNVPGSWSALGCIPTSPDKFIAWLLEKAINVVGGIALLLILFGSFRIVTSAGNPESLNEGKEIIFAAIAGLLFIILSTVLLKIIGGDILKIPGIS